MIDLGAVLLQFLTCASDALEEELPGRVHLAPGLNVAWDDCCDGQLWVRVMSLVPAGGQGRDAAQRCGVALWTANLGIGVVRCVAVLDDTGNAPPPQNLTLDTLRMVADMRALEQAIRCCMSPQVVGLRIVRWDPLGPEGGCAGGEWQITITLDACWCPDDPAPSPGPLRHLAP